MDPPALDALPHEQHPKPSDEIERITAELHMLALHSKHIQGCEESYSSEGLTEEC